MYMKANEFHLSNLIFSHSKSAESISVLHNLIHLHRVVEIYPTLSLHRSHFHRIAYITNNAKRPMINESIH
jgi:hypothetical protein